MKEVYFKSFIQSYSHSKFSRINCKWCSSLSVSSFQRWRKQHWRHKVNPQTRLQCYHQLHFHWRNLAGLSRKIKQISLTSLMIHSNLGPVLLSAVPGWELAASLFAQERLYQSKSPLSEQVCPCSMSPAWETGGKPTTVIRQKAPKFVNAQNDSQKACIRYRKSAGSKHALWTILTALRALPCMSAVPEARHHPAQVNIDNRAQDYAHVRKYSSRKQRGNRIKINPKVQQPSEQWNIM